MATMDQNVLDNVDRDAKNLKDVIDSLTCSKDEKNKLIKQMEKTYATFYSAIDEAKRYPATNDCDEYAISDVHDVFKKYIKS